ELEPLGVPPRMQAVGQEGAGRAADVEPGPGRREGADEREAVASDIRPDRLGGGKSGVATRAVRRLVMSGKLGGRRQRTERDQAAAPAAHEGPARLDED